VPVTSFNTRTGEVVLLEDDVLAALGYVPAHPLGYTPINKAGDTMTGPLTLAADPAAAMHAATRQYVLAHASGGAATMPGTYLASDFNASGSKLKFTGTIAAGSLSTLTLTAASDFVVGQGIFITNAGASGVPLVTKVDAIDATLKIITLHAGASAPVSSVNVQHDDTDAIQTAMNTVVANGGGRIICAPGFYRLNRAPGINQSILNIPFVPPDAQAFICLAIVAYAQPIVSVFTTPNDYGVIFQTDRTDGGNFSMIAAALWDGGGTALYTVSNISFYTEGIVWRTYPNPQISAVDLGMVCNVIVKQTLIDSNQGLYLMTSPPSAGTFGLRLPRTNTSEGQNYVENSFIAGYGTGVFFSELMVAQMLSVDRCLVGLQCIGGNHANEGHVLIVNCPTGLSFSGAALNSICDFFVAFEIDTGSSWFSRIAAHDIYDPSNLAIGCFRAIAVRSDAGNVIATSTTGLGNSTLFDLGSKITTMPGTVTTETLNANSHAVVADMHIAGKLVSADANDTGGTGFQMLHVPNSSGTPGLATGLVSYWKMDEVSGQRHDVMLLNDLSVNGADLSDTGIPNGNLAAKAAGGTWLQGSDSVSFGFSGAFTIAGWIYPHVATNSIACILAKWSAPGTRQFFLTYNGYSSASTPGFQFGVSSNGTAETDVSVPMTATPDTWYFAVAWFDGTAIHVQVNDGAPASTPFTGPVFHGSSTPLSLLYSDGSFNAFTDGRVDEVGIWSRVLTPVERTALYNSGGGLSYPF
jgi:hypothetical protein